MQELNTTQKCYIMLNRGKYYNFCVREHQIKRLGTCWIKLEQIFIVLKTNKLSTNPPQTALYHIQERNKMQNENKTTLDSNANYSY